MEKNSIEILNVGPIKEVKLKLNKFNVFMGEQSSGKSTIAKIISFCHWVEKDVALHQSLNEYKSNENYFIEKLESFHNLKGYFNPMSVIKFMSLTIEINYSWNQFDINWVDQFSYKRNKISYIPSERGHSVLPEIEKLELPNNYLKSFLFDWFSARKFYSKENHLNLLDIGVNYYYSESSKENHILSIANSYDILLSHASSGLQSVTSLIGLTNHLVDNIYKNGQNLSFELDEVIANATQILISELMIKPIYGRDYVDLAERKKIIEELNKKIADNDENTLNHFQFYTEVRNGLSQTHSTNLIIEELEQNLFPSTQKSLVYFLLSKVNSNKNHHLTLTTHSPYVLYEINNCIMASIVQDKLSEHEKTILNSFNSRISPDLISIYEIKNGKIVNIQQEDGLIGANFFDNQMKEVMDEYYSMLKYY